MNDTLHPVRSVSGISCDALLTEHGRLLFGSFWGRDTAVQEFLARLQLSTQEGGLANFHVNEVSVHAGNVDHLKKHTGRVTSPIFGTLIHLWIHDALLAQPERSARRAVVVFRADNGDHLAQRERVWTVFKTICPLPLLDAWAEPLLTLGNDREWLVRHRGIGVEGVSIELPEDHEDIIAERIRSGELTLQGETT